MAILSEHFGDFWLVVKGRIVRDEARLATQARYRNRVDRYTHDATHFGMALCAES
jgi:hypothetical protein